MKTKSTKGGEYGRTGDEDRHMKTKGTNCGEYGRVGGEDGLQELQAKGSGHLRHAGEPEWLVSVHQLAQVLNTDTGHIRSQSS